MHYKIKPDYVYIVVFALFVLGGPIRYGLEQLFTTETAETTQIGFIQE